MGRAGRQEKLRLRPQEKCFFLDFLYGTYQALGWIRPNHQSIADSLAARLLQLRVFRCGFLQDGDAGVGIFPEGEESLVGRTGSCGVSLQRIGAGETESRVIAGVREGLRDALACRERGDMPGSIAAIRLAMERLAALGSTLDPEEGAVMRIIAERFTAALGAGQKGDAKTTVDVMRRKAGDTKDDDKDW